LVGLTLIVENKGKEGNNNGVKESGNNQAEIIERKTYPDIVKKHNEVLWMRCIITRLHLIK